MPDEGNNEASGVTEDETKAVDIEKVILDFDEEDDDGAYTVEDLGARKPTIFPQLEDKPRGHKKSSFRTDGRYGDDRTQVDPTIDTPAFAAAFRRGLTDDDDSPQVPQGSYASRLGRLVGQCILTVFSVFIVLVVIIIAGAALASIYNIFWG